MGTSALHARQGCAPHILSNERIGPLGAAPVCPPPTHLNLDYPPATATDNCQLDYVLCTPPPGFPFPVGVTTTYTEHGDGENGRTATAIFQDISDAKALDVLRLRAERAGNGTGRIYTITINATDSEGQSSSADVTVRVPHDKK